MALNTEFSEQLLINPTLAIKAGSSAIVKSSNVFMAIVGGLVVTKAAGDMPALVGTIPTGSASSFVFYMNSAGTITVVKGNNVVGTTAVFTTADFFPQGSTGLTTKPEGVVCIGMIFVVNATGSDFVGGTTALDVGSLTVYYSNVLPAGF